MMPPAGIENAATFSAPGNRYTESPDIMVSGKCRFEFIFIICGQHRWLRDEPGG